MLFSKFSFSLMLVLLMTCSSNNNQQNGTEDEVLQQLEGEWTWVRSTGSIAGITVTPESTGRTMEIEFTSNSIFNKNVDDNLIYSSPFILQEDEIEYTTLANFPSIGLGFDHQTQQKIEFVDENKLLLIDRCCDNFLFEFVKKE